jgi:hypothetical protein
MAIDVGQAEVQGVFQKHRVRYEVGPYYVLFEQRPPGAPSVGQRIHAGFDVDLFGTLDKMEVPRLLLREEGDIVIGYFEAVAREVQSQVGQGCTVEIIGYPDSLVLNSHFQPEAMVRIRISHSRGQDQSEGRSEEQALEAIRDKLHALGLRES